MKRRNLLKGLGALGASAIIPGSANAIANTLTPKVRTVRPTIYNGMPVCWLTPQKTEGPYYFDTGLNRQDIRYDTLHNNQFFDGIQLNMTFTVIDYDCNVLPGVIVDIWHCDKDGNYSGYNGQPGGNWSGYNFMRGFQLTNANGQAAMITSYPGWYPGRATHIHFKVRLNSNTYVTSQFCFPDALNNTIHVTPLYAGHGINPTTNGMDLIFGSAEPQYLIMYPTPSGNVYNGAYTIGINSPIGINDPGIKVEGFSLKQNYPNPFNPTTKIGYTIPVASDVKLTVFDVMGKEVGKLVDTLQSAGTHEIIFDGSKLASGYYIYKMEAGEFVQTKDMLLIK